MKKIFLLFMATVMFGYITNAQNYLVDASNDSLIISETWTYDTVFMDTTFYIMDDIVLTIDPGVVVMFNGYYEFIVEGALVSQGTELDPIVYTVSDTTNYYDDFSHEGWEGIVIDNEFGDMDDNDSTYFAYCEFYFAKELNEGYGGGAIRIRWATKVLIENCLFQYNYASDGGAAIGILKEAEPIINKCTFINNTAHGYGGGAITIADYSDDALLDQPIISNCYFSDNLAENTDETTRFGGGAMKVSAYTDAYIYNNVFENNTSTTQGGAMIVSGYAQPFIVNNIFVNNYAEHNGGAIALKYYAGGYHINNTIAYNESNNDGGAYSIGCYNDSCYFANNIIGGNIDAGSDYTQFYIDSEHGNMKFYNNNIEDGLSSYFSIINVDNMEVDPLWLDVVSGDFRIACSSLCKDAGIDVFSYFPELDLAGMPRLVNGLYDLGAYEVQLADVNLGDDIGECDSGASVILDASADFISYAWSTSVGTQTIEVSTADTYIVTVTNVYLCEDIDEISVIFDIVNPTITCIENQTINLAEGETVYTVGGTEFDPTSIDDNCGIASVTNDFNASNALAGEDFAAGTTTVTWTAYDNAGNEVICLYDITINLYVDVQDVVANNISVYPNPTSGLISINNAIGFEIQIKDITGKIIKQVLVNDLQTTIDLSDQKSGMYFVYFTSDEQVITHKLIIK